MLLPARVQASMVRRACLHIAIRRIGTLLETLTVLPQYLSRDETIDTQYRSFLEGSI